MKRTVCLFLAVISACLLLSSLCAADFANPAGPQLEWISVAIPKLWDRPKADVLFTMSIFPDFECGDYGDRISCSSRFNDSADGRIYIAFFMDDYEEKHDNLWQVTFTVDITSPDQAQDLMRILWLDGMKPAPWEESPYPYPDVLRLFFANETTKLITYTQKFEEGNNPFFLAEFQKAQN